MRTDDLFDDLAAVRGFLASSPLMSSLDLVLPPLTRAIDALRGSGSLAEDQRERLGREVTAIGHLLNGAGQWLASRGALTPTYNRHAELDSSSFTSRVLLEG